MVTIYNVSDIFPNLNSPRDVMTEANETQQPHRSHTKSISFIFHIAFKFFITSMITIHFI